MQLVYKQGEKTALRLGKNNSKQSNRQRINLKNIQATPAAQFWKNTEVFKRKTEPKTIYYSKCPEYYLKFLNNKVQENVTDSQRKK